jgi:hypothetical protein
LNFIGNWRSWAKGGWAERYFGEILMNIYHWHISESEDWVTEAMEADKSNDTMWSLGGDYTFHAELTKRKSYKSEAKGKMNRVQRMR